VKVPQDLMIHACGCPTISTYQGWTLPYSGKFQPFQASYLQPQSFFPAQSSTAFGNSTRFNPNFRSWPQFNETAGLSRIFGFFKERAHLEVRGEAFNISESHLVRPPKWRYDAWQPQLG
jgi:hypothetical protein